MKKHTKGILGLCFPLMLTGCVPHWNKAQCQTNDMHQQGVIDGRLGLALSQLARYQSDCQQFAITLDNAAYRRGWQAGNRDYCKPSTLYAIGKLGKGFPVVCNQGSAAIKAYQNGHAVFVEIENLRTQIADIDAQLNKTAQLQAQYNDTTAEIARERQNVFDYKNKKDQHSIDETNRARANLAVLKDRKDTLERQLVASQVTDALTQKARMKLLNKKAKLQNKLASLGG